MTFASFGDMRKAASGNLQFSSVADQLDKEALVKGNPIDHLRKFNRFDLPEGFLFTGGLRGYLFFTRPDMYLFNDKNLLHDRIAMVGSLQELVSNPMDKEIISALQHNTGFPSAFIPVLTSHVKGYSPEDQGMEVVEKGETHHGAKIKYGKHSIPSRSAGTINLTFSDSKYYPVYKMLTVWTDYIEMVYLGDVSPRPYYLKNAILDYACAIYYIVTKSDGTEIVYWEKLAGAFPKTRPDSAFATTKGEFTFPQYTVQFEYSIKSKSSILDPNVLTDFNHISLNTHHFMKKPFESYDIKRNTIGEPYVFAPIIEKKNNKYYLKWY